ncbi:MAG TPA: inositol monophosphatase family protein, partial [Methylomirabilota bacterium]|jgi:myo-inositol-1(or 4)-monophosphatase|nr:inositol monophosphatase family protein [Methylomirabilota bacterium]
VVQYCRHPGAPVVRLLSEERGEILPRPDLGPPAFTLIVDPVDGSENFRRGLELTAFSVAVVPSDAPLAPAHVVAGLVGHVFTGTHFVARRGSGAFSGGQRLHTSPAARLAEALVAVDCAFPRPGFAGRVARLLEDAFDVRSLGSSVASQMGVAAGALDAYVDVRGVLTPENFMAGSLVIEEAGGVVSDPRGRPLPSFQAMTDTFLLVASATPALHEAVMRALDATRWGP